MGHIQTPAEPETQGAVIRASVFDSERQGFSVQPQFHISPLKVLQLHCVSKQLQKLAEGRRLLVVPEQLLFRHLVDRWNNDIC